MSTYNKQQTVHLLPVNFDTADVINSFLFQEITTVIKNKKREIVKKFKNAYYSRKIISDMLEMFTGYQEHQQEKSEIWAICLTDRYTPYIEKNKEIVFEAKNCQICGNYKLSQKIEIPENITCNCSKNRKIEK